MPTEDELDAYAAELARRLTALTNSPLAPKQPYPVAPWNSTLDRESWLRRHDPGSTPTPAMPVCEGCGRRLSDHDIMERCFPLY